MDVADLTDSLVVVDNRSNSRSRGMLSDLVSLPNVHLILNDENLGVATALNQGVRMAMEQGYQWALLLDQDTATESFIVETLASVYDNLERKNGLAIIGSNYYDKNTGRALFDRSSATANSWVERKAVITSGSLLSLRAFAAIGPFRDELFIDLVDIEYCLRARSMGFTVVQASKPTMKHALGTSTLHRVPWRKIALEATNHSPLRRYYMARNPVVLAREYPRAFREVCQEEYGRSARVYFAVFKEPHWVFTAAYVLTIMSILIVLFEDQKISKLYHILLGVWHGVVGKMGEG